MNCANHFDRERAAFCQNCGKPLCNECARTVGTSVFCEPCLTARVASTAPHAGPPYAGYTAPGVAGYPPAGRPSVPGEPNPGLAALLGFIPGVGAMYNEQYAKGIVHLMVFAVLVSLAGDVNGIFLLFVFGWVFYMAIEAYHTAKARRDGTPLPNPFGLNDLSERLGFGKAWPGGVPPSPYAAPPNPGPAGQDANAPNPYAAPPNPEVPPANPYAPPYSYGYVPPTAHWAAPPDPSTYAVPPVPPAPPMPPYPDQDQQYRHRFPSGAIWLIALGLLFLVGNAHIFHVFHGRLMGPILLIGVGVWLFVRRMVSSGSGFENDGTAYYQHRLRCAINNSIWVLLVGVIWLLDELHILGWSRSWPLFLIVAGVTMFLKRAAYPGYGYGYVPPAGTAAPPAAAVTTTDLVPTDPRTGPGDDQERR